MTTIEKRILAERYTWPHGVTVKPSQRPITADERKTAEDHLFSLGLIGDDCALTDDGRRAAISLLTVHDWRAA